MNRAPAGRRGASPHQDDAPVSVRGHDGRLRKDRQTMSTFLWILLGLLYLVALVVLGLTTLRKGHTALFWLGIIFPILWIVGALMRPTPEAMADARSGLA
jgi:hypothetical protein